MLRALRFFLLVCAPPAWLLAVAIVTGAYAGSVAWFDRAGVDEALAVVLLWQMVVGSTGFVRRASAGHFDPVLVRESRWTAALAHFLYSVAPGVCLWIIVAAVEMIRYPEPHHAFEIARVAALAFVSATAWAFSLPLARMVFGAVWLVAIVIGATTRVGLEQYAALAARDAGSFAQAAHAAVLSLACPFVLIGGAMPAREPAAAALSVAALITTGAAVLYLARRDYPLEAS